MSSNIYIINSKLKSFTKKYYLTSILTGFVLFLFLSIGVTLIFLLVEYVLYLNVNVKFISVITYLFLLIGSFIYLIIIPLLRYYSILSGLKRNKINDLIIKAFPEVKDKLINILELSNKNESDVYSEELIIASIDQKIDEVKYLDFNIAVNFKENIRFIYFLLGTLAISVILFFFNPTFYKDTSYRLINYKMSFQKPLPYDLTILNKKLSIGKGEDFTLDVKIKGIKENESVNLLMGGKTFLMKKDSLEYYSYKFNNINNDVFFQIGIDKYTTIIYKIEIYEKPILTNFALNISKPNYTSLKSEELNNLTEVTVPIGTIITFNFSTVNTDSLFVKFNEDKLFHEKKRNDFIIEKQILSNQKISIDLKNDNFYLPDYLKINISTINDEFPTIKLEKYADSTEFTKVYFKGKIYDDYGFSKLLFNIKINDGIDSGIVLNILKNIPEQEYFYAFDFNSYKSVKSTISYYFEVFDNDVITGPKSSVSEMFVFKFPDEEDIKEFQNKSFDQIENIFQNSTDLVDKLKKDLGDLKKKMLDSDLSAYDRKEVEKNITSIKGNLEKEMEKLIKKNEELNNYMKSFSEEDQKLIDKQNQIKDLLENVLSDELKKMLDDFNKAMEEFNKDKINNSKEKLDINLDDLSKQLDRNLAMLKKMQVEQKLDLISKNLKDVIEKQNVDKKSIEDKFEKDKLAKNQQELKEKADRVNKDYKDLMKLNDELTEPLNLYDFNNEFNEIKKEFENSLDQIEKGNKKKSKESLQKNSSQLENLSFNLDQMRDNLFKEQTGENIADLQQILDNLITYSFNQETVIKSTSVKNFNSVNFSSQKKLFNDFSIIKDSLYSLATREASISSQLNKELVGIQTNFVDIQYNFENNSIQMANVNQQKVLTSVNNLSLFLSEIIKKLQEQEANSKPGNQNCNKPGNKPNPNSMSSSMKSMQKSLQQQLEKIMQMMKEGAQGKAVQNEMGKAISQQESMHDLMQKLMSQNNVGSSAYETLKQADKLLEKVKEDILRNNISSSTIDRQKQILTRLLEAEKSENERDIEEQRKSKTAVEQFGNKFNTKNQEKKFEVNYEEKLVKNKLILNTFYQEKFQYYILKLDSINGEIYKNRIIDK